MTFSLLPTILFLLLFYFLLRPLYLGYRFAHPTRVKLIFFTPTSLGVPYEDVQLKMRDGVQLDGWYMSSHNGAAIILLHGQAGNRLEMVPVAEALLRAGYGVLMFDLRAHGMSGGDRFGRSTVLVDDVLTAVAYLRKKPEINAAGIGVCGVSVGALFALHAAARTVAIRAIVADRPAPATMADLPQPRPFFERFIAWPIQQLYMRFGRYFSGMTPLAPTVQILPRIAPRPVLFITGQYGIEHRIGAHLCARATSPSEHWVVRPPRYTLREQREATDTYGHTVVSFFDRFLRVEG